MDTVFLVLFSVFYFRPIELEVFFYNVTFKILSEVYRPELADGQSIEFLSFSKEVSKLVCEQIFFSCSCRSYIILQPKEVAIVQAKSLDVANRF